MDVDEVADELYGLDPSEFVEFRTARVAQARAEGDKALAAAIGKLRKPTTVGWLVNLLARELPEEIAGVLQLGVALRDAQRHLSAADLRTLTTQRQQLVRALAKRAGGFAADRGREVPEDALREVGQTLHAAMADPEVGEQVRIGRIITAASYSGFGPAGLSVVGGKAPVRAVPKPKPAETVDRKAAARDELADADAAVTRAHDAATAARRAAEEATATLAEVDERIDSLRAQLDRAENERQFARSAEKAAAEQIRQVEREVDRAERWQAKAAQTLEDLGDAPPR